MNNMKKFSSIGVVLGKLWGGGDGAYPAEKLYADTKDKLIKEAKTLLKNGGLDSGMGFEYLKGALLLITEQTIVLIKNKEYHHEDFETVYLGDLTHKDKLFLKKTIHEL